MKLRKYILPLLAVVLVLAAGIGMASAYFTTYVTAKGGYVIHLNYETEIHEDVSQWTKHVSLYNREGSSPIFVRAKVFFADPYTLEISGANWVLDSEGFYRYQLPLYGGETAGELLIHISGIPEDAKPGDDFNVIVVYESVPAMFHEDGTPDLDKAWATGDKTIIPVEGGAG